MKYLFTVFVIGCVAFGYAYAQNIQTLVIDDFSGGLVNSIANPKMQPNQVVVLDNFDITPFGWLKKRDGSTGLWSSGDHNELFILSLLPYMRQDSAKLLLLRALDDIWDDPTAQVKLMNMTQCVPTQSQCTTLVRKGFHNFHDHCEIPYNSDYFLIKNNLAFISQDGEFTLFDGHKAFPARPLGPGQARVVHWELAGQVRGFVRYKYCYIDTTTGDTSNFSAPTWPLHVSWGKVVIYDMWAPQAAEAAAIDEIAIYRETNFSGHYEYLATIPSDSFVYIDSAISAGDTTKYRFGANQHCYSPANPCVDTQLAPPGGMSISSDSCSTTGYGLGFCSSPSFCVRVGYSIFFVDSAGRQSYMAPLTCGVLEDSALATSWARRVHLSNIPVPKDSCIVEKILLRLHGRGPGMAIYSVNTPWNTLYIVDTLPDTQTTYVDSIPIDSLGEAAAIFCDPLDTFTYGYIEGADEWYGEMPESTCYDDSNISFQPSAMVYHGSRAFAVGDIRNRNRLYYSDFGRITTWPPDHFIEMSSDLGDWPVKLVSLGADDLLLFRQNSIWELRGLSFYQFSLSQIISNVGAFVARSVGQSKSDIYFVHTSGIYNLSGVMQGQPQLSLPIQNSFDSIQEFPLRKSWGGAINDEYWWSPDRLGNKTYIFSPNPVPHWKVYTIGIRDAACFNYDTKGYDYVPGEYIFIISGGTTTKLARFGSTWSSDLGSYFVARIKTKAFLDRPGRVKVLDVSVYGYGDTDSLAVFLYDQLGEVKLWSDTIQVDFTDNLIDRVGVGEIFDEVSIEIRDFGTEAEKSWELRRVEVRYVPWDEGKKQ